MRHHGCATNVLCLTIFNCESTIEGEEIMSTKKNVSRKILAIVAVAIIAVVGVSAVLAAYLPSDEPAEPIEVGEPDLVSINFQYTDDRTDPEEPFLRITGTVTNQGDGTANNCLVRVNAIRANNETAIDTTAAFDSLQAGQSIEIDMMFPYTGEALLAYNAVLEWTN